MKGLGAWLGFAALLFGCRAETTEHTSSAIIGVNAVDATFGAVGKYRNFGGSGLAPCSAVAVAPNLALTAAHCITTKTNTCKSFASNIGGEAANNLPELEFRADGRFDLGGTHYTIDGIIFPPGAFYRDATLCAFGSKGDCNNQLQDPVGAFAGRPSRDLALVHFSTSGKPLLKDIGVTPVLVVTDITAPNPATFARFARLNLDLAQFRSTQGAAPLVQMVGCGVSTPADGNRHAGFGGFLRDAKWPVFLWDNQPKSLMGDTQPPMDCDGVHVMGERIPTLRLTAPLGVSYAGGDSGGALIVSGGGQNVPSGVPAGDYLIGLTTDLTDINGANNFEMAATPLACPIKDPANLPELKACSELRDWLETRLLDFDGDGFRDTELDGSTGPDDCPITFDPKQGNGNLDSEIAYNNRAFNRPKAPLLGDKCESVPNPDSDADEIVSETGVGLGNTPVCTPNNLGTTCVGRRIHSDIDIHASGGNALDSHSTGPNQIFDNEVTVPNTSPRFCQDNLAHGIICRTANVLQDNRLQLGLTPSQEAKGDPNLPYHRVSVAPGLCLMPVENLCGLYSFGAPTARGTPLSNLIYGRPEFRRVRWDFDGDLAFWRQSGLLGAEPYFDTKQYPDCTDSNFGTGTCLTGVFWLNGDTNVGIGQSLTPSGNGGVFVGVRPPAEDSFTDRFFSNHYINLRPDSAETWTFLNGIAQLAEFPLFDVGRFPMPFDDVNGLAFNLGSSLPLTFGASQSTVFAETDTGRSFSVTSLIGPALASTRGSVVWVDAAEPQSSTAVALSLDGTELAFMARTDVLRLAQRIALVARRTYKPSQSFDDTRTFAAPLRFTLPATIPVTDGNGGNQFATLSFHVPGDTRTTICTYRGGAPTPHPRTAAERSLGALYQFKACHLGTVDDGECESDQGGTCHALSVKPGDSLATDSLSIHVKNGDNTEPSTAIRLDLLVNETGTDAFTVPPIQSATTPPARTGFTAVYSAASQRIFVLGGTAFGAPLSDVWTRAVDGAWERVDATLGTVLGATYVARFQRLYVLHQTQSRLELTSVSPFGAPQETVVSWPLPAEYDRFFVQGNRDGNVHISGTGPTSHRTVVFDPGISPTALRATDFESGRLLRAPIFDARTVSLVLGSITAGPSFQRALGFFTMPIGATEAVFP